NGTIGNDNGSDMRPLTPYGAVETPHPHDMDRIAVTMCEMVRRTFSGSTSSPGDYSSDGGVGGGGGGSRSSASATGGLNGGYKNGRFESGGFKTDGFESGGFKNGGFQNGRFAREPLPRGRAATRDTRRVRG
ncbi:unnamed protein product, partial [Laminaria digitata]